MSRHPLLNPKIDYVPEEESAAKARYRGFGADVFEQIYFAIPSLKGRFTFFRDTATNDLWSVCYMTPRNFGLQLDPDCEVICLWDSECHEEIGYWPPQLTEPVSYAIEKIRERYITND